jgi:hypothetical protein
MVNSFLLKVNLTFKSSSQIHFLIQKLLNVDTAKAQIVTALSLLLFTTICKWEKRGSWPLLFYDCGFVLQSFCLRILLVFECNFLPISWIIYFYKKVKNFFLTCDTLIDFSAYFNFWFYKIFSNNWSSVYVFINNLNLILKLISFR